MTGDDYVEVTVTIEDVRKASVFVTPGASRTGQPLNIPRALLHGADDLALDKKFAGDRCRLRIRSWKASELGLVGDRDDQTLDLFEGGN
jgi:hypothetical protein